MPQSLAQVYIHFVFSTKHRQRFLLDKPFRERVFRYLEGICRNHDSPSIAVGGVEDHVHILLRLSPKAGLAELIREIKRDSSKWIKEERPDLQQFYWQSGYGAFAISATHVDAVAEYIHGQEEHHRTVSFQDELRRLCAKNRVAIDERYVWN